MINTCSRLLAALGILSLTVVLWPGTSSSAAEKGDQARTVTPFSGKDLEGWVCRTSTRPDRCSHWTAGTARMDPKAPEQLIVSTHGDGPGQLVNAEGHGVDIYTLRKFGDCTISLEFMVSKGSNSGVYVMGEYEVQIKDSYGKQDMASSDLGGLYKVAVPRVNAAKRTGEWQELVIKFQAPRFKDGKKTANARFIKVVLNGQVIQENIEMEDRTPGGVTGKEVPAGPLMLQGDHGPVAYRNIKITLPSNKSAAGTASK